MRERPLPWGLWLIPEELSRGRLEEEAGWEELLCLQAVPGEGAGAWAVWVARWAQTPVVVFPKPSLVITGLR